MCRYVKKRFCTHVHSCTWEERGTAHQTALAFYMEQLLNKFWIDGSGEQHSYANAILTWLQSSIFSSLVSLRPCKF